MATRCMEKVERCQVGVNEFAGDCTRMRNAWIRNKVGGRRLYGLNSVPRYYHYGTCELIAPVPISKQRRDCIFLIQIDIPRKTTHISDTISEIWTSTEFIIRPLRLHNNTRDSEDQKIAPTIPLPIADPLQDQC